MQKESLLPQEKLYVISVKIVNEEIENIYALVPSVLNKGTFLKLMEHQFINSSQTYMAIEANSLIYATLLCISHNNIVLKQPQET